MILKRHLLIVDDDALTREVLTLVAEEAGFVVDTCDSGEAALAHPGLGSGFSVLLVDMQMAGLSGNALAMRLRAACATGTVLVAMSGSAVAKQDWSLYDSFLLKPFQFDDFLRAVEGAPVPAQPAPDRAGPVVLDVRTYTSFAGSMPVSALQSLYALCLSDAELRVHRMMQGVAAGDEEAFRRAAHAVKGSCGMLGARELAAWAAELEQRDLPPVDEFDPFPFFHAACGRLKAMLVSESQNPLLSTGTQVA